MGFGDFLKSAINAPLKGLDAFNSLIGLPTPNDSGGVTPGYASKPLEEIGSASRAFMSNYITRPLSTLELMGRETSIGGGDGSKAFSASEWAKLWHAAQYISPGQAIFYGKGPGDSDLAGQVQAGQRLINSPLQYAAPDKAQLPPGWDTLPLATQQDLLKQAGAPLQNAVAAGAQGDKFFHYASGAADFAIQWELDPMILGGKALGAVKKATIVRPTANFSAADIDSVMRSNLMTKTQQWLWANKDDPQLVNNLSMVRKSAMGPKFGAVLATLKSENEVNALLRVTMGDARAADFLRQTNQVAAQHLESSQTRLSLLGQQWAEAGAAGDAGAQFVIKAQMKSAQQAINADTDMVARYNRILDSAHELDALNLTHLSFGRAADRTAAQNAYTAGAARTASPVSLRTAGQAGGKAPVTTVTPGFAGIRRISSQSATHDVQPGVAFSRLYTDFWGLPVTVARAFSNFRPGGHIAVQGVTQDAINELRGYLARIPNIRPEARAGMLNDYLGAANEWERKNLLIGFEKLAVGKVAEKHGFAPADGLSVYRKHLERQKGEIERMNQYTTARMADEIGRPIRADFFHDSDGAVSVHPNLVTRLVNDHIMMDLDRFDQILGRHSGALKAVRPGVGSLADAMDKVGDFTTSMWKFGTLFRLGYIPRVLGDDLAGQVARLGAGAMAMRAMVGVKNAATNLALWREKPFLEQRVATREAGIAYAKAELPDIQQQSKLLNNFLRTEATQRQIQLDVAQRRLARTQTRRANLPADAPAAKVAAHDALIQKQAGALRAAQARAAAATASPGKAAKLASLKDREQFLNDFIDLSTKDADAARARLTSKAAQGLGPLVVNGVQLPGALEGQAGEMWQRLISPDQSLENIFGANKGMLHGLIQRSFDHGAVQANAVANPATHMAGWLHVINHQFAQDELGRIALGGASVDDMAKWLRTNPRGQVYWRHLGIAHDTPEYLANSVKADIDELVGQDQALRAKALSTEGVTKEDLEKSFPNPAYRPDVHVGQTFVGHRETLATSQKIFRFWFDTVAGIPAARWSRHPLFNQFYEGHAKAIMAKEAKQGVVHTVDDANRIAETARRLAYHDTRKLVFDIAHRSDAVAALRFMSPFFAATSEGWQRWARIIADKPETVGYAAKFFNTPLALGKVQDANGNPVDDRGYAYDPSTGKRYLVSKADRRIVTRLPGWMISKWDPLGKFFGLALGAAQDGKINLSQDSMNLAFNGDPVFNPGMGPLVTIPVQEFVADKPALADLAQKLGVLPFGVSTGSAFGNGVVGRSMDALLPNAIKNFLTSFNTSDERYQSVKLHIMQQATFEHTHFGKPMPSATEIAKRTKDYWLFSAASAFLGPIANKKDDPYQWYRDQYHKLRSTNPLTADDEFLKRYGESYFTFAQAETKNVAGIEASRRAVELSKKYADLLAGAPELGALITGSTGNGPFDPVSYAYQLNTPLIPGDSQMQRERMSAEEAMADNQRRLGWSKYTARMNDLTAQLVNRGLVSFDDPGAEDLKALKRGYTMLYTQPLMPDGTVNPHYIEAFAKDFNSYDSTKYSQLIPKMTQLVRSDLANDPRRTDLKVLGQYLGVRQQVMSMLNDRKIAGGSATLTAQGNEDLLTQWKQVVGGLIESNTQFGDLFHRYLSRDMGVDEQDIKGGAQ